MLNMKVVFFFKSEPPCGALAWFRNMQMAGFQFIFQLFLAFCWFKCLTSRTCRIHCLQKERTVWQECKGNNPECLYVHPGLKDVARIEFITLWGKLNLQNFSNVKNVHVKYTHTGGDEWNGCDHVLIERSISVRVNGETCVSFISFA